MPGPPTKKTQHGFWGGKPFFPAGPRLGGAQAGGRAEGGGGAPPPRHFGGPGGEKGAGWATIVPTTFPYGGLRDLILGRGRGGPGKGGCPAACPPWGRGAPCWGARGNFLDSRFFPRKPQSHGGHGFFFFYFFFPGGPGEFSLKIFGFKGPGLGFFPQGGGGGGGGGGAGPKTKGIFPLSGRGGPQGAPKRAHPVWELLGVLKGGIPRAVKFFGKKPLGGVPTARGAGPNLVLGGGGGRGRILLLWFPWAGGFWLCFTPPRLGPQNGGPTGRGDGAPTRGP